MLRLILAAALVGLASASSQGVTTCIAFFLADSNGEDKVECEVLMKFEDCLATENFLDLPEDDSNKIAASFMLDTAKRNNLNCAPPGDLRFDLDESTDQITFRFTKQEYSVFDINYLLNELEEETMTKDAAASGLATLMKTLSDAQDDLTSTLLTGQLDMAHNEHENKAELISKLDGVDKQITTSVDALEKAIEDETEAMTEDVESRLEELTKSVEETLSSYVKVESFPNNTADPKYRSNYELVMVERAPAGTQNGHSDRVFYKVNFNVNNPGFWYPNREELKRACRDLSNDLKEMDGIDRQLKPAADRDWTSDGDSVQLAGTYLSHCGCGGHPRSRDCAGMSRVFLSGAVMYNRQNSWHGCHLLRHDSRDCHHHWAHCYANSGVQSEYTICTSANDKRNVGPKGWCDAEGVCNKHH